ncbi:MAG: beta-lactamase family protein [Alphaproteobacteria bacterium]|nr:beta-lactamase family protein [Alphaproteobacteria bacterium]
MRILIRIVLGLLLLAAVAAGGLFALYESTKVAIPDLAKSAVIQGSTATAANRTAVTRAAERLEQLRREIGYPAVSVAVAVDGIVVWQEARGWASLEPQTPVKRDTPFAIGSVSKTLTAAVAMKLAERGTLDLDADIRKYLPAFPQKEYPITARQLLSHQAGVRHYSFALAPPTFSEFGSTTQYDRTTDSLAVFANDPLLFKPDTDFAYSTYGFTLLSAVMEAAAGKPFLDLMQSELFTPLALANTGPDDKRNSVPGRAADYQNIMRDGAVIPAPFTNSSGKWAGGGFRATPADLASFGAALLRGDVIGKESLQTMFTPRTLANGKVNRQDYALGVRVDQITDTAFPGKTWRAVHHGGVAVGSQAMFVILPDQNVAVALSANATTQPPARGMFEAATSIAVLFAEAR